MTLRFARSNKLGIPDLVFYTVTSHHLLIITVSCVAKICEFKVPLFKVEPCFNGGTLNTYYKYTAETSSPKHAFNVQFPDSMCF